MRPTSPRRSRASCSAAPASRPRSTAPRRVWPTRSVWPRRRSSSGPSSWEGGLVYALRRAERTVGWLVVRDDLPSAVRRRLEERVLPALEALLAAALERDRLQAEVVETSALRRSDELKTALLRSVSHDLRTPLTAILTAGSGGRRERHLTRGPAGARPCDHRGGGAADGAGGEVARPVAPAGRERRAAAPMVRGRRAPPGGRDAARSRRDPLRIHDRHGASARACRPDPARAGLRQPDRERAALLGSGARLGARPGRRRAAAGARSSTAAPGSRSQELARVFERFLPRHEPAVGRHRLRARAGDREGLRRGQRRQRVGGVAPRSGHELRGLASARARAPASPAGEAQLP